MCPSAWNCTGWDRIENWVDVRHPVPNDRIAWRLIVVIPVVFAGRFAAEKIVG